MTHLCSLGDSAFRLNSVKAGSHLQVRLAPLWPDVAVFCALVVECAISLVRSHVMSLIIRLMSHTFVRDVIRAVLGRKYETYMYNCVMRRRLFSQKEVRPLLHPTMIALSSEVGCPLFTRDSR